MKDFIDFNHAEVAKRIFYGGDAGAKSAIKYNDEIWMLKLPKSTRDYRTRQISYTTSPLSEYIGSKIYESLGMPVHETLLGERGGKVVVACKDFTRTGGVETAKLIPFNELKNAYMSSDLDSCSGTGSETLLEEVLDTIAGQEDLRDIDGTSRRFWDMFVVDAFIGNNDRNNGNWGLLHNLSSDSMALAPVYDNGNAFFNKRSSNQIEKRLSDIDALREDAYRVPTCAYKYTGYDNEAHKINPHTFIERGENKECNDAVVRFVEKIDLNKVEQIINDVPEKVGDLIVMPSAQKEFYLKIMSLRLDEVITPAGRKNLIQERKAPSLANESRDAWEASGELENSKDNPRPKTNLQI